MMLLLVCLAPGAQAASEHPRVTLETNLGNITLELYPDKAPVTVKNFLAYVNEGFYTDTIFHRVISGFMIQGGGLPVDMKEKPTHNPIANEAANGLKNDRGTIAMARTSDPNSATSQFFINAKDNTFLNFRDKTLQGYGYCVFGKVISGMEVVDAIEKTPTGTKGFYQDTPLTPVIITKAVQLKPGK